MKQKRTDSSPPFRMGTGPFGAWAMKYAAAIWPDRMKATGRVKSPSTIISPPKNPTTPPGQGGTGAGWRVGQEVRRRHLARQDEGHGARKEPQHDHQPAKELQHPRQ